MKFNWKLMSCAVTAAALLTGCEPPVDRNAETPDTSAVSEAALTAEGTVPASEKVIEAAQAEPHRQSDASMELVPDALKPFTEFPAEKTAEALKKYLDFLSGSEFQAAIMPLVQSQDESTRLGVMAAQKIISDNRALAADLILGAEDAAEEQYRAALSIKLDSMANSNASIDGMEVQFKAFRDQVAAGRFASLANLVDCQLNSMKLMDKVSKIYAAGAPKPEDIETIYTEYSAQVDTILTADALNDFQIQMILGLAQLFQDQPERILATFQKLDSALEKKTESKWTSLRTMLQGQIASLKKDVEIQATKPEQVKEALAPYRNLPEEKTAKKYAEYLKLFSSDAFRETVQPLLSIRNEEVQDVLIAEMAEIQKNSLIAADEIFKMEDTTEEEFKTAMNMKFQLAMAYTNPEEKPTLEQLKKTYEAQKEEIAKSRFPQFAPHAECCVLAISILEKAEPFFLNSTQPTPEQKEGLYPEVVKLAETAASAGAIEGLPMEVLMQCVALYRTEKEKAKPILETLIKGMEGKTDENSQMFLSTMKMQLAMLDNPQGMAGMQNAQAEQAVPSQPELTPEQIEELKKQLEEYAKLPEDKSAASLTAYTKSVDSPEFQNVISPLLRTQTEELQKWLTETMNRLNDSIKEALTLICKSSDATEEQFKEALQFRLDIMRADKVRKNIEPDYAALTEEVKASRFPALVSVVDMDASSAALMNDASALFSAESEPTAEQKDELFTKFTAYVEKVLAADALSGPQLQVVMQVSSIFAEDNSKIEKFCQMMLKGLEGKEDEQSKQLSEMFKTRLEEIEFLKNPIEFTAPEGTELPELKKLVTQKMEIIMRSERGGIPKEKLAEFLAAVEKFGNEKLTAYTSWQIDLIHMIPDLSGPNFDLQSFKAKYLACVKTGLEKELFNANCLQMCMQMAAVASQKPGMDTLENKTEIAAMLSELLPVCEKLDAPEVTTLRQGIDSLLKRLNEVSPEDAPKASVPTAPLAAPEVSDADTSALPENIQLEDAPAAETAPAETAPAETVPAETAPAETAPAETAPAETVPAEAAPAEAAPVEAAPAESTSAESSDEATFEEDEETEEEEAEKAPKVEIPAPILAVISLPEDADAKKAAEFLTNFQQNVQELAMQLQQLGNAELVQAVSETALQNLELAIEKILSAEDAEEEAYTLALSLKLERLAAPQTASPNAEETDFSQKFADLKANVSKGKFPNQVKMVEAAQAIFVYSQNFQKNFINASEDQKNELFEECKKCIPLAVENFNENSFFLSLLGSTFGAFEENDEQTLTLWQTLYAAAKEKESWKNLTQAAEEKIKQIELSIKPINFQPKAGATLEEMKAEVSGMIQSLTATIQDKKLEQKLNELKASVEKVGNADLTAFAAWHTDLYPLYAQTLTALGDDSLKGSEILNQLNTLADKVEPLKIPAESFMVLLQYSSTLLNFITDVEQEEKVAFGEKLLKLSKTYDSEAIIQIQPVLEQWVESLKAEEDEEADGEEDADADEMEVGSGSTLSDAELDAMKTELDAATEPFMQLPEEANAEKMTDFIKSFSGPDFESLITAMQQFPEKSYAQKQFEKMIQNLQDAVQFVLDAKDATPEQLKLALGRKLNWISAEEKEESFVELKKQLEKHNLPELNGTVDCYLAALQLKNTAQEKFQAGQVADEVGKELLTQSLDLLKSTQKYDCLDGNPLRVLFILCEALPAAEQKLELLKAVQTALLAKGTDESKELASLFAKRIEALEAAQKPAEFKAPKENASIDELKDAAHEQLQKFMEMQGTDTRKKMNEFLESVKKFGNAELTACVEWEIGLFNFFLQLGEAQEKQNPNDVAVQLAEIVSKGTELKALDGTLLQLVAQVSLNLSSVLEKDAAVKLFDAVKTALAESKEEGTESLLQAIEGQLTKINLPGKPIELEAETLDGKAVKIQDFKGKTVLIDVWATWCGPCVAEIPNIRAAYEAYHEAGFEVIGLSLDEDLEELKNFLEKEKLPWTVAIQPEKEGKVSFADKYGITGIPAMFLIDAEGKVITANARGQLMDLLAEIYPDVEVPEVDEVPDSINLDAEFEEEEEEEEKAGAEAEAANAGEEKAADTETEAESMSAVSESECVSESTADAAVIEQEESASLPTFQAPEGASLEAQKTAFLSQMMQLIQGQQNPEAIPAILEHFKNSAVQANADLETFAAWNVDFFNFFAVKLSKIYSAKALNAASKELVSLIQRGTETKSFVPDTLMTVCQTSMKMLNVLDVPNAKALVNALSEALDESSEEWAPRIQKLLNGKVAQMELPGKPLELEAATLDGKPVRIQDFKGKTVLVDVWATWCGPCVGEIPNMLKAYEVFHEAGFEIIGLSVDQDLTKLESFQKKRQLPWIIATQNRPEFAGKTSFSEMYGITGIPTMFLVGADGKVLTTRARGNLMELLTQIYPEAAAKAAEAERKAQEELEKALELDVPSSDSMSAVQKETEFVSESQADSSSFSSDSNSVSVSESTSDEMEAAPTVLDSLLALPQEKNLESIREFLEMYDRCAYEVQMALQQLPDEAAALKTFEKIMQVRGEAADLLIADETASPQDLKRAVGVKTNVILFLGMQSRDRAAADAAFEKLAADLEKRNAHEAVIQAQVAQLLGASQFASQMPTAEEMEVTLDKIISICKRAEKVKCMNGDLMGHFMQMIVYANDAGVPTEKIDESCIALRESVIATGDPQLLNTVDFITGMARRAALKGKTMELVGVTLDGKEVNIQKDYAGKVVLVDFWATWCNPCVMELTNLEREYYAKYHEKGFEILGFSIDVDKNQLAAFLERRKLPWQTILQKDNAAGCEEPVYYYGIQAIPCLILVGPDGKVIREIPTMRRDEVLTEELKKIYGE